MGFFSRIDTLQFIKLNYISKNVIREGKGKIIPFNGAHIELEKNSKLILHDESMEIGLNRIKGSKAETLVRLRNNAVWDVKGYCGLCYGVTVEINENAKIASRYFTSNSNSAVIVNKEVTIGNDVMLGRNVVIYDSDFHSINNKNTKSEPVTIGDHVWIATNSMVLKGVHIGNGSIVSAGTIVKKDVPEQTIIGNDTKQKILSEGIEWKR